MDGFIKKRLARALNNLSYHLNRIRLYEEALWAIEQSISLKEQGYVEFDTLADAYGEKSQILIGLGRFKEALLFDTKAVTVLQKCIDAGYTYSQEEMWVYLVNRSCLYLRLGRVDEAERLLLEAQPHIPSRRRVYRMFAKEALEEIERWRQKATTSLHLLDWRWVERYRELDAYDTYWWLAYAGPFTEKEQNQWDQLYTPHADEAIKEQLSGLLTQSRERELSAALAERREPHLHYPALDIEDVRRRIRGMLQLDADIFQEEPNAIVRRLYHDAIEEEVDFLRLIEATFEGDEERFREFNYHLGFIPTDAEMNYALTQVKRVLLQGQMRPDTREVSQHVIQLLQEYFQLSLDFSSSEEIH